MNKRPQSLRIGIAIVVVLGTIVYLAISAAQANKSYYVTITELQAMGNKAYTRHLRVAGNVAVGSIARSGTHAQFTLIEQGKVLPRAVSGRRTTGRTRSRTMHRPWRLARTGAMASSTQPNSRPSAPRNMRRSPRRLREQHPKRLRSQETPGLRFVKVSPADKVPDGASVGILASGMEERVALLSSVSKMYGQFVALRKVSFYLKKGHCYLLLGDNGAGKSTLLRVLAGLLTPTLGSIEVRWDPSQPAVSPGDARPGIGYMSHAAMLYDELMAAENLAYFGGLYPAGSTLSPETALTAVGTRSPDKAAGRTLLPGHAPTHFPGPGHPVKTSLTAPR